MPVTQQYCVIVVVTYRNLGRASYHENHLSKAISIGRLRAVQVETKYQLLYLQVIYILDFPVFLITLYTEFFLS